MDLLSASLGFVILGAKCTMIFILDLGANCTRPIFRNASRWLINYACILVNVHCLLLVYARAYSTPLCAVLKWVIASAPWECALVQSPLALLDSTDAAAACVVIEANRLAVVRAAHSDEFLGHRLPLALSFSFGCA
jgi:hypothetical protein